jgi:large subunit ribosomal protein L24
MHKMRVHKGDVVHILSGKDRGKEGRVIEALPRDRKVVVENLNLSKRHTKPRPIRDSSRMGGPQMLPGGIVDRPTPLPVSNVMVVCPVCKRPTRIGVRTKDEHGSEVKVRFCRRADCGQEIDR